MPGDARGQLGLGPAAWVAVAAVVTIGMVVFTGFLVSGFLIQHGEAGRLEAPGEAEIALEAGVPYVLFHEYRRADDSVGFIKPAGEDGLRVQIQRAGGGPLVEMRPHRGETYAIRREYAESLQRFAVPEPGVYRVVALFATDDPPDPLTLTIRPSRSALARAALARGGATQAVSAALVLAIVWFGGRRGRVNP